MKVNSFMLGALPLLYPTAFGFSFVPNTASAVALTSVWSTTGNLLHIS